MSPVAMGERRENDHYVSPPFTIRRLCEAYVPPAAGRILDPCAARGELIETAKPFFPGALWAACDINPAFKADLSRITGNAVVIGDFFDATAIFAACHFDFVLTNPPYNQAEAFIKTALEVSPVVAMLLRVNFLASQKRRDWLAAAKPGIFILPNRPSFTGAGGDMTEYAWFVFGDPRVAGRIDYLAVTPLEEIRAANKRAKEIHGAADAGVAADEVAA